MDLLHHCATTGLHTVSQRLTATRSAINQRRRERCAEDLFRSLMVLLFGILSLVFTALDIPALRPQLAQAPPAIRGFVIAPSLWAPLIPVMVSFAFWIGLAPPRRTRMVLRAAVTVCVGGYLAANIAVLAVNLRHPGTITPPPMDGAHIISTGGIGIPLGLIAMTFSLRTCLFWSAVLAVAQVVARVWAGGEELLLASLDVTYGLALSGVYVAALIWLLDRAQEMDRNEAILEQERDKGERSWERTVARRRAVTAIHDYILAALVATRADMRIPREGIRAAARDALDHYGPWNGGRTGHGSSQELADYLSNWVDSHGAAALRWEVTCRGNVAVPLEVWTGCARAATEALRNVLRHAFPPDVTPGVGAHVRVCIEASGTAGSSRVSSRHEDGILWDDADTRTLALTIEDHGVGFTMSAMNATSMGIRESIIGRMEGLRGGVPVLNRRQGRGRASA